MVKRILRITIVIIS